MGGSAFPIKMATSSFNVFVRSKVQHAVADLNLLLDSTKSGCNMLCSNLIVALVMYYVPHADVLLKCWVTGLCQSHKDFIGLVE